MHHLATPCGHIGGAAGQLAGLARVGRGALHGLGQPLYRHGGFFQRGSLLFGTLGKVVVAFGDLARTDRNGVCGELDLTDDGRHRLDQRVDAAA
ncbi:hypothetical protein D3C72_1428770 [compost metagenome]